MMQWNRERNIILTARLMSLLFTPFYLPLVGLMALFVFSYLGLMPWAYNVPYVISILCYFFCVYLMDMLHVPHFMGTILSAALFIQVVCALINVWWKISTHTAAIGGVAGALFVFGELFGFNPVWWLCIVFILAGLLGTSRMILRQHSLDIRIDLFISI